jgi:anaerobic selenocysteine-containing dehydrogenase
MPEIRGGTIVVIDPRRTETAAVADEHHFIRPGTDALFLLATLHVLFGNSRIATGMREFVHGIDELEGITRPYTPERVAEATGIEAGTIRRLALSFARAPSAVYRAG